MKEIIEKYKKGELRVKDCSYIIQFRDGDVIRNVYNDKSSGTQVEECVTDKPVSINDCNTNLGYTNPNYFVATCAALDKEIAAMEKQPKYEYVQAELSQDYEHLMLMIKGERFYDCRGDVEYYFNGYGFVYQYFGEIMERVAKWDATRPINLYRRVEITPEQKREREVEGLAMVMREKDIPGSSIGWCSVADSVKVTYRSMAKTAIEWMESKK